MMTMYNQRKKIYIASCLLICIFLMLLCGCSEQRQADGLVQFKGHKAYVETEGTMNGGMLDIYQNLLHLESYLYYDEKEGYYNKSALRNLEFNNQNYTMDATGFRYCSDLVDVNEILERNIMESNALAYSEGQDNYFLYTTDTPLGEKRKKNKGWIGVEPIEGVFVRAADADWQGIPISHEVFRNCTKSKKQRLLIAENIPKDVFTTGYKLENGVEATLFSADEYTCLVFFYQDFWYVYKLKTTEINKTKEFADTIHVRDLQKDGTAIGTVYDMLHTQNKEIAIEDDFAGLILDASFAEDEKDCVILAQYNYLAQTDTDESQLCFALFTDEGVAAKIKPDSDCRYMRGGYDLTYLGKRKWLVSMKDRMSGELLDVTIQAKKMEGKWTLVSSIKKR